MDSPKSNAPLRVASAGHAVFAVMMIAIGIQGVVERKFNVIWQPVPKWVPAREVVLYVCAIVPLLAGIGLLWRRTAAPAARALLAWVLLWLVLLRVPPLVLAPSIGTAWAICKTAVLAAAAWVVYTWFATDWDRQHLAFAAGNPGVRIARGLYGPSLIFFGVAHFAYLNLTTPLVPSWLPWHVAWAYITGATFILAGLAIVAGIAARLAAVLATWQIGLFTLLVWVPIVAAGSPKPSDWGEFVVSCVLTACAWVVADSYRGGP